MSATEVTRPRVDSRLIPSRALESLRGSSEPGSVSRRLAWLGGAADQAAPLTWRAAWVLTSAGSVVIVLGGLVLAGTAGALAAVHVPPPLALIMGGCWAWSVVHLERRLLRGVLSNEYARPVVESTALATLVGVAAALPVIDLPAAATNLGVADLKPVVTLVAPLVGALVLTAAVAPLPGVLNLREQEARPRPSGAVPLLNLPPSDAADSLVHRRRDAAPRVVAELGGMRGDLACYWPSLARAFRPRVAVLAAASTLGAVAVAIAVADTANGLIGVAAGALWAVVSFVLIRQRCVETAAARGLAGRVGAWLLACWTVVTISVITTACLTFGLLLRPEVLGSVPPMPVEGLGGLPVLLDGSGEAGWAIACLLGVSLLCYGLPLVRPRALATTVEIYEERLRLVDEAAGDEGY